MTREECEKRIIDLLEEIRKTYYGCNPDGGHLNLAVYKDYISAFNAYWEEEESFPIDVFKRIHTEETEKAT